MNAKLVTDGNWCLKSDGVWGALRLKNCFGRSRHSPATVERPQSRRLTLSYPLPQCSEQLVYIMLDGCSKIVYDRWLR
jgi:hypothetical protein